LLIPDIAVRGGILPYIRFDRNTQHRRPRHYGLRILRIHENLIPKFSFCFSPLFRAARARSYSVTHTPKCLADIVLQLVHDIPTSVSVDLALDPLAPLVDAFALLHSVARVDSIMPFTISNGILISMTFPLSLLVLVA